MPRLRRAALPGFPAVGSVSANGAAGTGSAACHTRAPGAIDDCRTSTVIIPWLAR